jgi:diaminopimelate decarboxylase
MVGLADGIDIASGGELAIALAAGAAPYRISFAGPGKRDEELAAAITAGVTINLESPSEAQRAMAIADQNGLQLRAAIRVNPDFAIQGAAMRMGGGAKPFGMDVPLVAPVVQALRAAGADWRGFHIYAGSQNLRADTVIAAQAATLLLTERLAEQCGIPAHVNLGGGFGIPYFPGDCPLDIAAIGSALAQRLAALPKDFAGTQFAIELGRFLVGEAGVYLTQIVDRKQSEGQIFLVVDGGLHHQLAASGNFGTVIRRNYPAAIATHMNAAAQESASIVGCLCTPLDLLCENGSLPVAGVGDIVAIFCAGAYGASASPAQFLGHGPAVEKFVK